MVDAVRLRLGQSKYESIYGCLAPGVTLEWTTPDGTAALAYCLLARRGDEYIELGTITYSDLEAIADGDIDKIAEATLRAVAVAA